MGVPFGKRLLSYGKVTMLSMRKLTKVRLGHGFNSYVTVITRGWPLSPIVKTIIHHSMTIIHFRLGSSISEPLLEPFSSISDWDLPWHDINLQRKTGARRVTWSLKRKNRWAGPRLKQQRGTGSKGGYTVIHTYTIWYTVHNSQSIMGNRHLVKIFLKHVKIPVDWVWHWGLYYYRSWWGNSWPSNGSDPQGLWMFMDSGWTLWCWCSNVINHPPVITIKFHKGWYKFSKISGLFHEWVV